MWQYNGSSVMRKYSVASKIKTPKTKAPTKMKSHAKTQSMLKVLKGLGFMAAQYTPSGV